jgi:hypothetical protein
MKPLWFQWNAHFDAGGEQWMWLPSTAPSASLKKGQNLRFWEISGGHKSPA